MSKTFAVTGVARGIGAELAQILQGQGHRVIGFDVQETTAHVDEFIALDLNDSASIDRAAAAVTTPLDGLCNNAGLPPREGLEQTILQVNFLGQRQFTQAMLPKLGLGAAIVNMASRAGAAWRESMEQNKALAALRNRDEIPSFIAAQNIDATRCYNLSKEAMVMWTMAMTEELIGRGLRANSISPGAVATGILDDFARAFGDKMTKNVARAGRPATAVEVAQVAAFLLSDQSAWIKGIDLPIDGGMVTCNLADAMGLNAMLLPEARQ